MDSLERELMKKAREQGYDFGYRGLPYSRADWEPMFQETYLNAARRGREQRQREQQA